MNYVMVSPPVPGAREKNGGSSPVTPKVANLAHSSAGIKLQ